LVVVALGGHAIAPRGVAIDVATQRRNVHLAADALVRLAEVHDVVLTHGNGPQVGLLAAQAQADPQAPVVPLDVLGAESDGMIGYILEAELRRRLPERDIATLLTQVEVGADDPAFDRPEKPIGPVYGVDDELQANWSTVEVAPGKLRRVVASPQPTQILELAAIRKLVESKILLICAGGGGIPVARASDGELRGVEAVVDKDLTSELLAEAIGADALLLLTDEPAVYTDWPEKREPIAQATASELRVLPLDPGSMGPKVEAACRFVEATGRSAVIGALEDAHRMLSDGAGTRVRPEGLDRDLEPTSAASTVSHSHHRNDEGEPP
jgi:carbamate kinase